MMITEALTVSQAMIARILPLYAVMLLGFIFGRLRKNVGEPLSFLQIYFIVPVVVAGTVADLDFQPSYLTMPIVTLAGGALVGLMTFVIGKRLWKDNTANLFGYACGSANSGYFGLPVALVIFPPNMLGLFIMAGMGVTLFDCSLGYYLLARGHFTVHDSLRKLGQLPVLYAFALGVAMSVSGHHVADMLAPIVRDFRGCYVVIGALLIGIGLSRLEHLKVEPKLLAFVFTQKFLCWPLYALAFIAFDNAWLHLFASDVHKMIMLLSIMPLPANAIAFALQLNVQPDKASTLVFLSTLFALFYIPLVMALWG